MVKLLRDLPVGLVSQCRRESADACGEYASLSGTRAKCLCLKSMLHSSLNIMALVQVKGLQAASNIWRV